MPEKTATAKKTASKTAARKTAAKKTTARKTTRSAKKAVAPFGGNAPTPAAYTEIGRIPITGISPVNEGGAWAAKGTENEAFPVQANVFREGHDLFGCEAVLVNPKGKEVQTAQMVDIMPGLNRYEAWLTPTYPGSWSFFVRSWSDPVATWRHNAEARLGAGVDTELVFLEADQWLSRLQRATRDKDDKAVIKDVRKIAKNKRMGATTRFAAVTSDDIERLLAENPLRDLVTESARFPINVDRERALYGSWYEMFPRSCGAYQKEDGTWVSGTLKTATEELDRVASMGFNVIYVTPIHPIGLTNRKGRDNTLVAMPEDPGSPYAIGSEDGGHDAIHPELGTFEDWDNFVAAAKERGMEVAIDFALQCSPDHPWLKEHPEWFTTRADGTIAFAENPPKKYQDIYPLNFDNDPEGIYKEIWRVLEVWIKHGVTIFRMDNPHTKPVAFWQRLLTEMRAKHPEIIFLAEAFTKPPMMQALAMAGFHLNYTYFTWRNEKKEIEDYLWEVARVSDSRLRPAFFPTTPDILTSFMVYGGVNAFKLRAVLAATGAPTWGIYSGYELAENVQRPGSEEFIDNEKYEFKDRDYAGAEANGIAALLAKLNEIRAKHPALQRLRHLRINPTTSDRILSFTKFALPEETADGKGDAVVVVLNLDPANVKDGQLALDFSPFEILGHRGSTVDVTDELTGETFTWNDNPYVKLTPGDGCAHVLSVKL